MKTIQWSSLIDMGKGQLGKASEADVVSRDGVCQHWSTSLLVFHLTDWISLEKLRKSFYNTQIKHVRTCALVDDLIAHKEDGSEKPEVAVTGVIAKARIYITLCLRNV